jgi:hypothetical protein
MIMNNRVFGLILVGLCASMHIQSMNGELAGFLTEIRRRMPIQDMNEELAEYLAGMDKRAEERHVEASVDTAEKSRIWREYEAERALCFETGEKSWSRFLNFVKYMSPKNIVVSVRNSNLPHEERINFAHMNGELKEELEHELGPDFLFIALDDELDYYVVKKLGIVRTPAYALSEDGRNYAVGNGALPSKAVLKDAIIRWFNREDKCAE